MADEQQPPERAWDEYDWERFLQQQDRKTERYMELLEKYIDDPNRDQIIAKEMGWTHLLDEEGKHFPEDVQEMLSEDELELLGAGDDEDEDYEEGDEEEEEESDDEIAERFESHPLYQAAFALTLWIDQLFDSNETMQNDPAAVKLSTQAAVASAKLAAALSDDDIDEIGMTIAYLKRALKAVTGSLEATIALYEQHKIEKATFTDLRERIFQVRDGIISLMGQYREEWRRRYGGR